MMNRLLVASSRQAASSLRTTTTNNHATATTISSTRLLSSSRYFSDVPSAHNSDDSATTTTTTATNEDQSFTRNPHPLTFGTVKTYLHAKEFGFIIPDGVDENEHANADVFFVHRSNIKTMRYEGAERYYPTLERGMRVRFRAGPAKPGKESRQAFNVTLEGGALVPPFPADYLQKFAKNRKGKFGDELFELFGTVRDRGELETRIVAAYDGAREDIERQSAKVERVSGAAAAGDAKQKE